MEQIKSLITWIQSIGKENMMNFVIALIIIIAFNIFNSTFSYILMKIFNMKEKDSKKIKKSAIYKTLRVGFSVIGMYIAIYILGLPKTVMQLLNKLFKIIAIVLVGHGIAQSITPSSKLFKAMQKAINVNLDKGMANFISKIIKTVIYIVVLFIIVAELNFDLSGLVAGLGISGVLVALAAQDLAKNLFGGFAVIMDNPFKIGDWIEVGDYAGTVTDITFRSTRLKTIENTEVTIQNSLISTESIINWSKIDRRRYSFILNLALETPMETIERLINRIKFILKVNPNAIDDTIQANFNKINGESLQIEVFFYTPITVYNEYLKFKSEVNKSILKLLDTEDIHLSYPGQNVYIKENVFNEIKDKKNNIDSRELKLVAECDDKEQLVNEKIDTISKNKKNLKNKKED